MRCVLLFGVGLSLAVNGSAEELVTPAQWLAAQPKPVFKPGHRLPHLSKWSWPYSYALRVEMATNWGYALPIDGPLINGALEKALANTNSDTFKLVSLALKYPTKFKLQVDLDRSWPTNLSNGFWVTNAAGWFVDAKSNTWQFRTNPSHTPVVSPEAPESDLTIQSEAVVAPLRLLSNTPVAIVLNGGERDLGVAGFDRKAWQFDPRVLATAVFTDAYDPLTNPDGMGWFPYVSQQKARHLANLTAAVASAAPNRELYVWYGTGTEQTRTMYPGSTWDNTYAWGWRSDFIVPAVETPSFSDYYKQPNSYTNATGTTWNNATDLLTKHLNAVGYNLALGYPINYGWVNGGNSNTDTNHLSDIARYTGLLKCLYTSGMIGAVAGYFVYPTNTVPGSIFGGPGFAASFPSDSPPHWLQQIAALSRVHALFSHLDNFILDGDLLSGPQKHFLARDQPAYEFTNPVADAYARVLVRKLRARDEWLITAWAASGPDREVTVVIPRLGSVKLVARDSGSVYIANTNTLSLQDLAGGTAHSASCSE